MCVFLWLCMSVFKIFVFIYAFFFEQLNQKGEAEVTFTNEEFTDLVFDTYNHWYPYRREYLSLSYKTFDLKVNVTDVFTDDVMTAATSLKFYDRAMSLRFTSTTPSTYKPGLPFTAYVSCYGAFFFFSPQAHSHTRTHTYTHIH